MSRMQRVVLGLIAVLALSHSAAARSGPLGSFVDSFFTQGQPAGGQSQGRTPPGPAPPSPPLPSSTSQSGLPQIIDLRGCKYTVRGSETLAYAAASLNIQIDDLVMAQNNTNLDLTAPGVWTAGKEVQIPCPGSNYNRFFPLYVAGCFFQFRIPSRSKVTLLQLVLNPPSDIGGPLTIQGIWTANWQSTGTDLTAPGALQPDRTIEVPTCGHNRQINPDRIPRDRNPTGCFFEPPASPGSDRVVRLSQITTLLGTDIEGLQKLNPGKNLTPDTIVSGPATSPYPAPPYPPPPPPRANATGNVSSAQGPVNASRSAAPTSPQSAHTSIGRLVIPCPTGPQ